MENQVPVIQPVIEPAKKKHGLRNVLLVVLGLVLLAGVAAGGYLFGKKKGDDEARAKQTAATVATGSSVQSAAAAQTAATTTKDTPQSTASSDTTVYGTCPSSPAAKTFYNKVIGLQFCYPKEWGDVEVGSVPASASDKGSAYQLTFSAQSGLTIASATSDWKNTVGRGGSCADPVAGPISFAGYNETWVTEGAGMALSSAARSVTKSEPRWVISETADDFFGGVCLNGLVATTGGAYELQTVNYRASFSPEIASVKAHVDNPNVLVTPAVRVQFGEMVDSIQHAN